MVCGLGRQLGGQRRACACVRYATPSITLMTRVQTPQHSHGRPPRHVASIVTPDRLRQATGPRLIIIAYQSTYITHFNDHHHWCQVLSAPFMY